MNRTQNRRGFTLIELMVVIGIILVLVAIVTLGLRHVNSQAAQRETQSEMVICQNLLVEFKTIHGNLADTVTINNQPMMSGIEQPSGGVSYQLRMPSPWNFTINLPVYFDSPNPAVEITGSQPQSVLLTDDFAGIQNGGTPILTARDMGDKLDSASARYFSPAVTRTAAANYLLLREPKNRSSVSGVPAKRLLEAAPQSNNAPPTSPSTLDAAVILDGWGNPIVFVPRGGMHVMIKPPTGLPLVEYIVRSTGIKPIIGGAVPAVSPNDQAFFASAGQDGVFTDSVSNAASGADYAIDNIYSFQR